MRIPGKHAWSPETERWRSLVHYWMRRYGGDRYEQQPGRLLDRMMGVLQHESGGDPDIVSRLEWQGPPPPGYDGTAATRASGLFQHVPAWWPGRAAAAGFDGADIFDPTANVAVACWLLWDGWYPQTAPNWRHWKNSYQWTLSQL